MTDKEKQMEDALAASIQDALGLEEMAARLVPRTAAEKELTNATIDYATRVANGLNQQLADNNYLQQPKKPVVTPVAHFAESLGNLNKAFIDLQALYVRLLGESGSLKAPTGVRMPPAVDAKAPIIKQMHDQAAEVSRCGIEMSALIAQIRDHL
jgi:hypothetical protein